MNTGLDPEILAFSGDYIVPAEYFLPAPTRIAATGLLNPLSYDNAAIEMRPVHSPSTTVLINRTVSLLETTRRAIQMAKEEGVIPDDTTIVTTPAGVLRSEDTCMESVQTFGCSPSMMVMADYSSEVTIPHATADATPVRSAGFHVHQELADPTSAQAAVAVMDGLMGLLDVIHNERHGWAEASKLRRAVLGYGKAGEHRVRIVATGATVLEYRSMSPWPITDRTTITWVLGMAQMVCRLDMRSLMRVLSAFPPRAEVMSAINEGDAKEAKKLMTVCRSAWRRTREGVNAY